MMSVNKCRCCGAPISNLNEFVKDADCTSTSDSYNILMHVVPEKKFVRYQLPKLPAKPPIESAYKEAFCHLKHKHEKVKACYPQEYLPVAEKWIADETTYKSTYKKFSKKKRIESRGQQKVKSRDYLSSTVKFKGKSETKEEFRDPVRKQHISKNYYNYANEQEIVKSFSAEKVNKSSTQKHPKKKVFAKPWARKYKIFESKTTYKTSYKVPKPLTNIKSFAPPPESRLTYPPFRHTTQYMRDFTQKPLAGREDPKWHPNNRKYRTPAPEIAMESRTSYQTSFSKPHMALPKKWNPTYSLYKSHEQARNPIHPRTSTLGPHGDSRRKPQSNDKTSSAQKGDDLRYKLGKCGLSTDELCNACIKKIGDKKILNLGDEKVNVSSRKCLDNKSGPISDDLQKESEDDSKKICRRKRRAVGIGRVVR